MIDFKGMLFLMLNPFKIFSRLFSYDLLLKCADEMVPVSHMGTEASLWLPVIIVWLLPKLWAQKLDVFVVLSQTSLGGWECAKNGAQDFWKLNDRSLLYSMSRVAVACLLLRRVRQIHPACHWVKITDAMNRKLSLQYYDVNLICICTLQFERTMWHLPACKAGGNVLSSNS